LRAMACNAVIAIAYNPDGYAAEFRRFLALD
jgi:hypothetical protein